MPEKRIGFEDEHWKWLLSGLPKEGVRKYFLDEEHCRYAFQMARWPETPICECCKTQENIYLNEQKRYHCKTCRHQFSATAGTVLHSTKMEYSLWFAAAEYLIEHKKYDSPYLVTVTALSNYLGVAYETARKMREKLLVELELERGGLLGTTICVRHRL